MKVDVKFPVPGTDGITDPAVKEWIDNVFSSQVASWADEVQRTLVGMIDEGNAVVLIPRVTIDLGSAGYMFTGGGVTAYAAFLHALLPSTATTTSNAFQTALNYTGRGILKNVTGLSQVSGGASTAAGFSVQITIDGNVVYTGAPAAGVNTIVAVVGQLWLSDPTNEYVDVKDDPVGLPFNKSCKIEYKSGTNGQGVSLGWRVTKKL